MLKKLNFYHYFKISVNLLFFVSVTRLTEILKIPVKKYPTWIYIYILPI
ncbi:CLUMA_CG020424, isoform A [Clunio marinus]|uniref:CLUMA_CG020424, isoform A n=1 Tax=Clunio marinus TaxID=568069 RepID=A0A1J1J4Y8_9DIPT|nr:CLUMA_CG020424, isoform A [Clunio marinus]